MTIQLMHEEVENIKEAGSEERRERKGLKRELEVQGRGKKGNVTESHLTYEEFPRKHLGVKMKESKEKDVQSVLHEPRNPTTDEEVR
ncbi:hypothetical protein CHS0354_009230 [Potamilus streckersoni]|uniref:Uncharacterized protein n=1 Tax=Potamilus streckersoni TaxID=2493646 RepID=A0AAE0S6Z1_9BIVA|nr:hypothetical protein CHS0354_009230 [Potamilus streckersoni]